MILSVEETCSSVSRIEGTAIEVIGTEHSYKQKRTLLVLYGTYAIRYSSPIALYKTYCYEKSLARIATCRKHRGQPGVSKGNGSSVKLFEGVLQSYLDYMFTGKYNISDGNRT